MWILGTGESISHVNMSQWPDFTRRRRASQSGKQAFGRAGVTPSDIDLCCLYDSFTSTVLLTLEGLGFCKPGRRWGFRR